MSDARPETRLQIRIIPVTPLQQNCSLIWDTETKHAVLVDPGGDTETLMGALDHFGLTLKEMWLTHGHLDHAGAAAEIRERTGVPVIGPHKDDQFWLDQVESSADRYGLTGLKNVTPDRYLEDGDVLFQGSIGRTDFPRGNHQQLIDSITEKLWPLGDDMTFVPGHGPTSTFGQERRSNPFVADRLTGYAGAQKTDGDTFDQKTAKRYT